MRGALLTALTLPALLWTLPAAAQRGAAALDPDSATVGQVVRVAVMVTRPAGTEATFPDSLALPPDMEAAGPRTLHADSAGDRRVTAVYPVTAWRPGRTPLGTVAVAFSGPGSGTIEVRLPDLVVVSVLPVDTTGIEARPPRDVLGPDRVWWPLILGLLVAAAVAALAWWLWRRHRARTSDQGPAALPVADPREEALAALARAGELPLDEPSQVKFFHARLTAALRRYAATLESRLGVELTTTELAARVGAEPACAPLLAILRRADLVKFARQRATAEASHATLASARAWVEAWPPPVVAREEERAA
jgi:hypothetical protein